MDATSKEVGHKVTTPKDVENDISLEEQLSETTSSQVWRNKMYDQAALKARVIQPCLAPADLASKIPHIKANLIPNTIHGTQDEIVTNNILLQEEPPDQPLNQQIVLTPKDTLIEDLSQEPPDFKAQNREGVKQAIPQVRVPDQKRGVILSFLLNGEPPNALCITKLQPYQGKGYDADIQIKPNRDHTKPVGTFIKPIDEEHFGGLLPNWSLNQAQCLGLINHQQINPKKTNDGSSGVKDQGAESSYYGNMTVALFFPYLGFVPMGLLRKVFNEAKSSHQGIIYQANDSKISKVHEADVLADRPAELPAELSSEEPAELLLAIYGAKGDQLATTLSLFVRAIM
ncbi:hypothetical protein AT4G07666 [Arabidopsis thaliana]|uniref:Uncharacterized protein n=1 Tax=Arabidopsis thaliana TaxID=3702 RepID=F4JGJ5_ARATH|nr:uncharacterized protein AT4G07666 [Arabidopsis thaliana]AEE82574.1 hypothetical protein AT4G07666 [Arabidopsis thaliana]|eukprot:NP_680631.1 hypothetical protein AT4G07666 [Arabidopsis thaliana]